MRIIFAANTGIFYVITFDEPYTKTYYVTYIWPDDLVRIEFRLGFRVDHAISYIRRHLAHWQPRYLAAVEN